MTTTDNTNDDNIAFKITNGDIQQESLRIIGRRLTDDELLSAADKIDWGLSTGIYTIFRTAIEDAVKQ
jgi:hypothetical protein